MNRSRLLGMAGVVVLAAACGGVWLASTAYHPIPLPPVGVPKSEAVDPDASGPVWVEYRAPKPGTTLGGLLAEADAVLAVMLATSRVGLADLGASSSPYSIYDFTIRDVVKGDFRAGDNVKIARVGGRSAYEPEFPRPGLGEEFLVFLKRFPEVKGFRHLYGQVAFRVVNGELQSMGPLYREVTGRKVYDVLRELRARVRSPGD